MTDPADIMARVANAVAADQFSEAAELLRTEYKHAPTERASRQYTPTQSMGVFLRDGFVDRYSGQRLVNPGVLRLFAALLPDEFPFQTNWKMSETHVAFWELFPTIDHLIPIARGGRDDESNWVSTSMLRNGAKANALLEEIEWKLYPKGSLEDWDGLTSWFIETYGGGPDRLDQVGADQKHLKYIRTWLAASERVFGRS